MKKWFRKMRDKRFAYRPLVEVRVSRNRLIDNLHAFEDTYPDLSFAPVLKSNAYGHGLIEVAHILKEQSAIPFFIVDSYYEALRLRNEGVRTPILIIGYTFPDNIIESTFTQVAFMITSIAQLRELVDRVHSPRPFHLKVDTGMHRQGILLSEVDEAIELIQKNKNISIEGLCSHMADADGNTDTFSQQQIGTWNALVQDWKARFPETHFYHLSPGMGHRFAGEVDATTMRVGVGLYGFDWSHQPMKDINPVMSVVTHITSTKSISEGEHVGYNITFTATKDMTIATLPMGYYEGIDRRLSNKGSVLVKGVECPIVGRVSMNITSIDVSHVPGVKEGDEVIVISGDPDAPNSITNWAKLCKTIPYELLVHIPTSLRRVVF